MRTSTQHHLPHRLLGIVTLLVMNWLTLAQEGSPSSAPPPTARPQTNPAAPQVPADSRGAEQALQDSPRHGEWVNIPIGDESAGDDSAPGASLKSWIVYPERKEKAPVVLVIHEIFGLTDWVRAVADQLAAEGFIAVAPDLLSGKGPEGGGTESFKGDAVRDAIRKISNDELTGRLNAARRYAIALPAARDKTGVIGFCWGGSASFTYATRQPELNAAVVYYGTGPMTNGNKPDKEAMAKIVAPVLGLYGEHDARVTSTVEATAAAMAELNKSFTHQEYTAAGHGFLRQRFNAGNERDEDNTKAAEQSWVQTIAFLRKHLEP